MFPVPEHKSKIFKFCKSSRFYKMLNKPSLAKSVVGREGNFFGVEKRLDFNLPLIIRKIVEV
jgi:hypothetical protein